jgi:hypothetical protein
MKSILNTRLLVIHFIAFLLIMYGAQMFGFIFDYKFLFLDHTNRINYPSRMDSDMAIVEQVGNFGLILSFILSWVISSRKNWHWINSIIVFVLTFAIENWVLLRWTKFHNIYLSPGGLFHVFSKWGHIAEGTILLVVGLSLLFLKAITRFISHDTAKDKEKAKAAKKAARKGK